MTRTKGFKEIVQAKAEFIEQLSEMAMLDLHKEFERIERIRSQIEEMPARGIKQRERKTRAYDELFQMRVRLHQKLGALVLETYFFCDEHRGALKKKTRRKLFGEDK